MNRVAFILSIAFLAASVAGRYKAELEVKHTEGLIAAVEADISDEQRRLRALETSKAYLERPDRLEEIAMTGTELRPVGRDQLYSAPDFVAAFDPLAHESGDPRLYYPDRPILQARAELEVAEGTAR